MLKDWFNTPLGKRLRDEETRLLQQLLPPLFGYHLLQVGAVDDGNWLSVSRIKHRCVLATQNLSGPGSALVYADALPIQADCVDVVVLPHVLEFEDNPHQVLREVERVLIAEGHVIVLGFNPLSLWGLRRLFKWHKPPPWNGRFRTALCIKDWLALLGFEIHAQHSVFFSPPFRSLPIPFLERSGKRWWPQLGGVYAIVAKKRVATLTPIKPRWVQPGKVLAGNAARPSARGACHEKIKHE
jgi:SAM-dependent methyltransferase